MNVKLINKGASDKGNENVQTKILHRHSTVQTPVVFHKISKPSPVLSDRSEFPSLNESSGKTSKHSHSSGKILKYSDKLKSHSFAHNQNSVSENFYSVSDAVVISTYNQLDDKTCSAKITSEWHPNRDKSNFNKDVFQDSSQNNLDKPKYINAKKEDVNSNQTIPKKHVNQSLKVTSNKQPMHNNIKLSKQKNLVNTSTNLKFCSSDKASTLYSSEADSKSNNEIQFNKSLKLIVEKNELKEEKTDDLQNNAKAKKKKKRKSKVKRQVSLQSGKITVLTPEVHFKILNQTSALTSQNSRSILTDINDQDEYPELGKSLVSTSQKENCPKREISAESSKEIVDKPPDISSTEKLITKDVNRKSVASISEEKIAPEKKEKIDSKTIVHPNDPITVSFFDILVNKNVKPKVKDHKDEIDVPSSNNYAKIKTKKNACLPHNLLDSSSPMIKRGKEREKPKPKKPSQLKKIILLDRKTRKEQFLLLKNSNFKENAVVGNELVEEINAENPDNKDDIIETNNHFENKPFNVSSNQLEELGEETLLLQSDDNSSLQDELVLEMEQMNLSKADKNGNIINELSSVSISNEDVSTRDIIKDTALNLQLDKVSKLEVDSQNESYAITESVYSIETPLNVSHSPDLLLYSLINNVKKSEISDKERAAKILLHTRNFREYCNHLISKDIDDVVFALLDDLARFQDRLHQKDPVKARMKRRMIYGVKEVKKHIKLKKLKCIIVAVDIENVEAQGGLNDVLNDIKMSAADHHIPCVFALSRKVLGKVCHKPVPVSCVGVFNFEGSEGNFKKMVELQTQSKIDYNEIFNKLTSKLSDDETAMLLTAKKEAPEMLRAIRTDILNKFFIQSKTDADKNESINLKSSEQMSSLIDTEIL